MAQANICEAAWIEVTPPPSFKQPLQSHATPFLVTTPPHDYHGKALCKGDGGGCIIAKPEAPKSKPQPTNTATSCPPAKIQPYCPDPPPSCPPPLPPPNFIHHRSHLELLCQAITIELFLSKGSFFLMRSLVIHLHQQPLKQCLCP